MAKDHAWPLMFALLACCALASPPPAFGQEEPAAEKPVEKEKQELEDPDPAIVHAKSLSRAFRKAAARTMPTVVKVKAKVSAREVTGNAANPFKGTPLEQYFQYNDNNYRLRVPARQGLGSGVIIDRRGVVLTNNHVIEGADEVLIELQDGTQYQAIGIKADPSTDLAVLRIKPREHIPEAALGDSDDMEIGDWVIAVGHPFELDQTVSAGIISGKGREIGSIRRTHFLQTDAAINPGNSGGPLVNLDGEVVGINTAIYSKTGGYQGVGFAIPINHARWVAGQLVETGQVNRAYLGVQIESITQSLAEQLDVTAGRGVIVANVYPNTPASRAGLQEGDIITDFGQREVNSPRDLQELVERAPLDAPDDMKILRDGEAKTLLVQVEALPQKFDPEGEQPAEEPEEDAPGSYLHEPSGIEATTLTAATAEGLGLKTAEGVLVSRVVSGSVAAGKEVEAGMVIVQVNRKKIVNVRTFQTAMNEGDVREGILLLVRVSGGSQKFIVVKG